MERLRVRIEPYGDVAVIDIDSPPVSAASAAVREGLIAAFATWRCPAVRRLRRGHA
jgi:enoyl-CoA hydratase/carnithine racemase